MDKKSGPHPNNQLGEDKKDKDAVAPKVRDLRVAIPPVHDAESRDYILVSDDSKKVVPSSARLGRRV
jgi:hypothetical protein